MPGTTPDPLRARAEHPAATKLVTLTKDAESLILYCARVSSDQSRTDVGLIHYLIKNGHWSPFEMAHAVIEFNTSRGIGREILRHRSMAFQEFSQRYAKPAGAIGYTARQQAAKNRQSSIDDLPADVQAEWQAIQQANTERAFELYEVAVEKGVARESARFLLPESTQTLIYVAGSIRSWIHYFEQRCNEHTQLEHRVLAEQARSLLAAELPVIANSLKWAI